MVDNHEVSFLPPIEGNTYDQTKNCLTPIFLSGLPIGIIIRGGDRDFVEFELTFRAIWSLTQKVGVVCIITILIR
jgi:hypothetical protein